MLVLKHMHREFTFAKWMVVSVLGIALVFTSVLPLNFATAAIKDVPAPGELPASIDEYAKPISAADSSPRSAMDEEAFDQEAMGQAAMDTANQIWLALKQQRIGNTEEAIEHWLSLTLPPETDTWRQLALAMAYLQTGNTEDAARLLATARQAAPNNALVHYCTGRLRLQQAETAREWYDAVGPSTFQLTALHGPLDSARHTKSMYELAARNAFEKALTLAENVSLDAQLINITEEATEPDQDVISTVIPQVRDVLEACGMENWAAQSHVVLGDMYRMRGSLEHAEKHLDAAATTGIPTGVEYRELGEAYERAGLHREAARAYLKALSHGQEIVGPAMKAWDNLREAFGL